MLLCVLLCVFTNVCVSVCVSECVCVLLCVCVAGAYVKIHWEHCQQEILLCQQLSQQFELSVAQQGGEQRKEEEGRNCMGQWNSSRDGLQVQRITRVAVAVKTALGKKWRQVQGSSWRGKREKESTEQRVGGRSE